MKKVHERFISYAKIYTTSDEDSKTCPSTERQFILAELLVKELNEIGLDDVKMDKKATKKPRNCEAWTLFKPVPIRLH